MIIPRNWRLLCDVSLRIFTLSFLLTFRTCIAGNVLLAVLYAGIAKVALVLFATNGIVSLIWPPSGLALAALLLGGRQYWPGVLVGAFAAHLWTGSPLPVALLVGVGNLLGALLSYGWLTAQPGFSIDFDRLRHFRQLLVAAMLGATVAAWVGNTVLLAAGILTADKYGINMLQWWQGDVFGALMGVPVVLVWRRPPWRDWFLSGGWRVAELVTFMSLMLLVGQIVYVGWWNEIFGPIAQSYWSLLFVVWAAVRFGRHGVLLTLGLTGEIVLTRTLVLPDFSARRSIGYATRWPLLGRSMYQPR